MSSNYEYHYRHRSVTIERDVPVYIPPPAPLPPLPAPSRVVYVEVERPPPPPKKRVVFIEVEKPPPPPPPPARERVVVVRVEKPALPWPLRPSYNDVWGSPRFLTLAANIMSGLGDNDLSTETSEEFLTNNANGNDNPPKIIKCRFAERNDLRKIGRLVKCSTLELFPKAESPGALYEETCLALLQENEREEIVSAIFLCNYPNVPAVSQSSWPSWMDKLYDVQDASAFNTLFVHLLVWDERYQSDCLLDDLLTATFYVVARCHYVVLVVPPTIEPADAIRQVMTRVAPKNQSDEVGVQVLYVGDRRQFVPQMKFRLLVEEDNDDVIQMLDSDTTLLREFYGDFYVSELSRHPDPWRRIVIGDTDDRVAAVACLNEQIDYELLSDRFELTAFDGLRKRTVKFAPSLDDSVEEYEDYPFQVHNADNTTSGVINTNDDGIEFSNMYSDYSDEEERLSAPDARGGDAFALELLGFRSDEPLLQASSQQLLGAAFECFPRLRYCLALMPTNRLHFPFFDHFTRVPLKADKEFPMALYLLHRASIQGTLRVREARREDYKAVSRLLLDHSQNILADFNEALKDDNDARRCYLFTCDDIVAGLAIVCNEEEVDRLAGYYRVEDLLGNRHRQHDVQRLLGLALAPIFQASSGFFLAEIMRLEGSNALFYRSTRKIKDVPSCLSVMQAVKPRIRRWPQFQRFFKREHDDLPFEELFSLYVTSPRLSMMTKQIVNVKIIVVGASDCGIAFIDALASGYEFRDLQFADVTLISTNGLPDEHSDDYSVKTMIPFRGRYCHAYRSLTSGRANYNVVRGTVVEIDRKKQQVYIEDSGTLSYDYLVLTCGLLFQRPELAKDSNHESDGVALEVPSNYFSINDDVEALNCLREIQRITENFKVKKSIVFHGSNIECYCALAAFLELGLEGSWITLIEPKLLASDDIFIDDRQIRDQLGEIIARHGVKLLSGYELVDWKLDSDATRIEGLIVLLENDQDDDAVGRRGSTRLVTCDALLGFHAKSPCLKTFLAISRAGLVFDGRLVIDAEFRTNDRRVFAAGTMTKYSRRFNAVDREHKYFNSLEVGEKLAEKLVSIIISEIDKASSEKLSVQSSELPEFQAPIIVSCLLPGGYRYLHVRKPGVQLADNQHTLQAQSASDVLSTGSCTADTGYFRLRLNQFRTLECVTCFGKTDYDIQNVIALYGKHEALLNDLKTRFLNAEIPDFYSYFREPWATALFSDDFDEFCLRNKRSDHSQISSEIDSREELFHQVLDLFKKEDYKQMRAEDREEMLSNWLEKGRSTYEEEVRERLIEYLERHEDELPMYLTPEKRRRIQSEIEASPLLELDRDNICQSSPRAYTTSNEDNVTHVFRESDASECHCSGGDSAEIVLT